MATQSTIEWTEQTWNPTTGCTKVSPGCKNCYAEVMARRLHAMGAPGYENGFKLTLHETRLEQPLLRKKPTTYFVNSMSDLFHEAVPDAFLDRVFSIIERTPHHTYQILTKRAERLPEYFARRACPRNVWLGVSVEDKKYGVPRIAHLRKVDAHIRFLSGRAAAGRPRTNRPARHSLGHRRWRVRAQSPADARRMGGERTGPGRGCWCGILFQAMGRLGCRRCQAPQEGKRPHLPGPHVGRVPGSDDLRLEVELTLAFHVGRGCPELVCELVFRC
ncbi:MAG: hypothetical protein KatS3mg122_2153 [Caldimonas sp.]|nr:MAG: hypothetical protein KatS3mg122_2153 [Caldimonas sp.]